MTAAVDITFRTFLAVFALVGLGDSLIFAFNALNHKETEIACKDGTCIRLSKTPHAAVFFHIPNWIFGIAYYLLTILAALTTNPLLVGMSLLGVLISCGLSVYLIHSLIFKLKAMCKLCYLAHAMNFALLWMGRIPVVISLSLLI